MIRNGVLKKKMSLRTEVLIASVGSVLLVAVFLSASYIQLMRRIIDRATVNTVSQTMLVLNGQVDAIFKPYEVTVRNVAHAASSHADRNSLAKMVQKAVSSLDTMDNDVYYATTISRYQEGGFYIDGSNWNPGEDWIPSERDWWKDADAKNFTERTDKYADFFSKIKVLPDLNANGRLTLGENLADHGGLQVAYTAFLNATKRNPLPVIDGLTPAQRFFVAYAGVWAGNITEAEIRNRTKSDPHSLGRWRVNGALPHIDAWYEAFGVKAGDKMYLPKSERLPLW